MKIIATPTWFATLLLQWHESENDRELPWKNEKDPYKIWLSEVILQQTRAEQGLPYYLGFIGKYPTVKHLADADEDEVFKMWQGLGYYNRCRNLLATARIIVDTCNSVFPDTYDKLLELKGIGPYTAAAIASFAFGRPTAVVDGNVMRVLARTQGIWEPMDTTNGRKMFAATATSLLEVERPAQYNQAIMDFGATVCKPKKPLCNDCILKLSCVAFRDDKVGLLPVKSKSIEVSTRYFNYFVFHDSTCMLLGKRTAQDIWQNLHEPYLVETGEPMTFEAIVAANPFLRSIIGTYKPTQSTEGTQKLTHRIIKSRFYDLSAIGCGFNPPNGYKFYSKNDASGVAFPRTVSKYIEEHHLRIK